MKITTIIPIHEYNETISVLLDKAIESIDKQENCDVPPVIIVAPQNVLNQIIPKISSDEHSNISYVSNEGNTDYQSQVNLGVKSVITDYFSVLEFDDEYSIKFFSNFKKHVNSLPEVDVFLSMMVEVNDKNEGIKLTNEMVWSQQFVGENGKMGYLNANSLKQYTDFKLSGAAIKKSEFENLGGYKSNIKLTFMFEFLLRALNNGSKIYSIPKIGYKHLVNRENSLFDVYSKTMSMPERKFWFETAVSESNFNNDRVIDIPTFNTKND